MNSFKYSFTCPSCSTLCYITLEKLYKQECKTTKTTCSRCSERMEITGVLIPKILKIETLTQQQKHKYDIVTKMLSNNDG